MNSRSFEEYILKINFEGKKIEELSDGVKRHFYYQANTNERGKKDLEELKSYGIEVEGRNFLDIGCGLGGLCIAAKKNGARTSWGIDIDDRNIDVCKHNLEFVKETTSMEGVHFLCKNILYEDVFDEVPKGFFDIICLTSVFEHVYDTARLINMINRLSSDNAIIYYVIPNGLGFFEYIFIENHFASLDGMWKKKPYGISFLEPQAWGSRSENPNIYYKRWDHFAALFSYYGFEEIEIFYDGCFMEQENLISVLMNNVSELKERLEKVLTDDEEYRRTVLERLKGFEEELNYDCKTLDADRLQWKYLTPVWRGVAKKNKSYQVETMIAYKQIRQCEIKCLGNDLYNVRYNVDVRDDIFEISVLNPTGEDLVFAYYLYLERKPVKKVWYSINEIEQFQLIEQGTYYAEIFVKKRGDNKYSGKIQTPPFFFPGV